MRSRVQFAGHPIHPMLVPFPIALLTWSLASLIIYQVWDNRTWYDISYWSGIAGVVGGLLAALPGFAEYFLMPLYGRARAWATAHMLFNLATVGLFAAAVFMMRDGRALSGTTVNTVTIMMLVGFGTMVISGWLGGHMVYVQRIGVEPLAARSEAADEREARNRRAA